MLVVLVTAPTGREAKIIARKLVGEKLAKCVNIVPVNSFFEWKGEFKEVKERLLIIKTAKANYAALEKRVKELHSYDTPEIIALRVEKGFKPYLDWIES